MQALIAVIGLVFAFIGLTIVVKPQIFKKMLSFCIVGNRIYLAGVIRFIIGVIFLVAAGNCVHRWLIIFLGILIIISAVFIFTLKPSSTKKFIQFWLSQNNIIVRVVGLAVIIFGIFICYAAAIK